MKKYYFIAFLLFVLSISGFSQKYAEKAERKSLECLNAKFIRAGFTSLDILAALEIAQRTSASRNVAAFEANRKEADMLLTMAGFYKEGHLNITSLMYCMLYNYNTGSVEADENSSFHKLLMHLKYLERNPEMLSDLSFSIQIETIKKLISKEDASRDFFKLSAFILFQGITKEMESVTENMEEYSYLPSATMLPYIQKPLITEATYPKPDVEPVSEITVSETEGSTEIPPEAETRIYLETVEGTETDPLETLLIEEEFSDSGLTAIPIQPTGDEVFLMVEKMPEFPGGNDALQSFIYSNLKYPGNLEGGPIQDKVYVSFVIDKTGKVKDARIIKGVGIEFNEEALRVINMLPAWTPGKQNGVPVNVEYTLPIIFVPK